MKHTIARTLCILAVAVLTAAPALTGTVDAAKGGAVRMTAPRSSMPAASPKSPATGAGTTTTKNAAPSSQTTQGKTDATSNTKTQQNASQANTQARTNTQQSGSFFGSAMRNMGIFAGGMFLGSMLSSMFGWGNMGFMSEVLGMVFNIILLLVVINVIKWLWRRLRGRSQGGDAYQRGYEAAMRDQQKRRDPYTIDVKPIDEEKDPFLKK